MTNQRKLVIAWAVFALNSVLCILFFDPNMMGLGDVTKGLNQLQNDLFDMAGTLTIGQQAEIRVCMMIFTIVELEMLRAAKLLTIDDVIFYLIWPLSAFLATKIKQEFVFFPFYMIAPNLGWKKESVVFAILTAMTLLLDEHNGLVIMLFRIGCMLCWLFGSWSKYLVGIFLVLVYYIDQHITVLFGAIPALKVYAFTRDVVNPGYSVADTLGVFLSSLHFSVYPQTDWKYDVGFSFVIVLICVYRRGIMRFLNLPAFLSTVATMFFFTSLTHSFQNARYYYFYLPVISEAIGDQFWFVAGFSVLHILAAGALHHIIAPGDIHGIVFFGPFGG